MAMWAGVQKVSRPMERCQETSQAPPMEAEVTARTPVQIIPGDGCWLDTCAALLREDTGGHDVQKS